VNRGRHLYSAGRPSRWALAHICSCVLILKVFHNSTVLIKFNNESPETLAQPRVQNWECLAQATLALMGPSSPRKKEAHPNFRPMSVVAKRLDGSRCHLVRWSASAQDTLRCVRWGPSSPLRKGAHQSPTFRPMSMWPNGWMDQDASWCGGRPQPRHVVSDGDPVPPHGKSTAVPHFSAHISMAKRWPISATAELFLYSMLTILLPTVWGGGSFYSSADEFSVKLIGTSY